MKNKSYGIYNINLKDATNNYYNIVFTAREIIDQYNILKRQTGWYVANFGIPDDIDDWEYKHDMRDRTYFINTPNEKVDLCEKNIRVNMDRIIKTLKNDTTMTKFEMYNIPVMMRVLDHIKCYRFQTDPNQFRDMFLYIDDEDIDTHTYMEIPYDKIVVRDD